MNIPKEKALVAAGHYGCGKTNFALNLARYLRGRGEEVTLIDLDIVNPYFRSGDYAPALGCRVIAPTFLGTTLDTPSLSAGVDAALVGPGRVLIDAGGDDAGAAALGRYSARLRERGCAMLYVINAYRNLTQSPEEAVEILREIEAASRLTAMGLVNNSNLGRGTRPEDVETTGEYARRVSELTGLPILATCAPAGTVTGAPEAFPVDILVRFPWEGS